MTPALREQLTVKALETVACNTMERVIGQSCKEASSKIVRIYFRGAGLSITLDSQGALVLLELAGPLVTR